MSTTWANLLDSSLQADVRLQPGAMLGFPTGFRLPPQSLVIMVATSNVQAFDAQIECNLCKG